MVRRARSRLCAIDAEYSTIAPANRAGSVGRCRSQWSAARECRHGERPNSAPNSAGAATPRTSVIAAVSSRAARNPAPPMPPCVAAARQTASVRCPTSSTPQRARMDDAREKAFVADTPDRFELLARGVGQEMARGKSYAFRNSREREAVNASWTSWERSSAEAAQSARQSSPVSGVEHCPPLSWGFCFSPPQDQLTNRLREFMKRPTNARIAGSIDRGVFA